MRYLHSCTGRTGQTGQLGAVSTAPAATSSHAGGYTLLRSETPAATDLVNTFMDWAGDAPLDAPPRRLHAAALLRLQARLLALATVSLEDVAGKVILVTGLIRNRRAGCRSCGAQQTIAGAVRVSEDPNCVLSTWRDADNDPCGWLGVTCVDDGGGGRVGDVELANFSLTSYLPSELSLPYNQLAGQIPVAITTLQKLAALLAHNLLSSYIPAEIGRRWRCGGDLGGGFEHGDAHCRMRGACRGCRAAAPARGGCHHCRRDRHGCSLARSTPASPPRPLPTTTCLPATATPNCTHEREEEGKERGERV
ncbi:leucine-rich repeat/receptor protein kinase-like [Oryza sativa Japonica Group]|uniref:Leucine-rich repeat/receptor protein kinase-like n=1 Tax=Oryza sativa subsp. japonica TaxID=39947 RepID=Q5ZBG6_ORYSJ|nr:leucine-rich repeat/receptor protein kinase-like [Oryza sativa Japonica Group]BAD61529.1 leucine-rich repeat/receptor protein kinase-like [Oryza sativa Japonica Group]